MKKMVLIYAILLVYLFQVVIINMSLVVKFAKILILIVVIIIWKMV